MTTPRKHWFRVPDAILHELPTPELRGMAVSLIALMNQRWARDGLGAEEASCISMGFYELSEVTGRTRFDAGLAALDALAKATGSLSFTPENFRPCVYFITAGQQVKIGYSTNLEQRLATIRRTEPDAKVAHSIETNCLRETELGFHKEFAELRIRGEWFRHDGKLRVFLACPACVPGVSPVLPGDTTGTYAERPRIVVNWRKVAEYQGWFARERSDDRPLRDADAPAPAKKREGAPEQWVNILGKEHREKKLAWLTEILPQIEADAESHFADKVPTAKALQAEVRSRIKRYWNQHERNPQGPPVKGQLAEKPRGNVPEYKPLTPEPQTPEQKRATAAAREEAAAAVSRAARSMTPNFGESV